MAFIEETTMKATKSWRIVNLMTGSYGLATESKELYPSSSDFAFGAMKRRGEMARRTSSVMGLAAAGALLTPSKQKKVESKV